MLDDLQSLLIMVCQQAENQTEVEMISEWPEESRKEDRAVASISEPPSRSEKRSSSTNLDGSLSCNNMDGSTKSFQNSTKSFQNSSPSMMTHEPEEIKVSGQEPAIADEGKNKLEQGSEQVSVSVEKSENVVEENEMSMASPEVFATVDSSYSAAEVDYKKEDINVVSILRQSESALNSRTETFKKKQSVSFSDSVDTVEIPALDDSVLDDLFYWEEELATFRYEAFMEKIGLDSSDFDNCAGSLQVSIASLDSHDPEAIKKMKSKGLDSSAPDIAGLQEQKPRDVAQSTEIDEGFPNQPQPPSEGLSDVRCNVDAPEMDLKHELDVCLPGEEAESEIATLECGRMESIDDSVTKKSMPEEVCSETSPEEVRAIPISKETVLESETSPSSHPQLAQETISAGEPEPTQDQEEHREEEIPSAKVAVVEESQPLPEETIAFQKEEKQLVADSVLNDSPEQSRENSASSNSKSQPRGPKSPITKASRLRSEKMIEVLRVLLKSKRTTPVSVSEGLEEMGISNSSGWQMSASGGLDSSNVSLHDVPGATKKSAKTKKIHWKRVEDVLKIPQESSKVEEKVEMPLSSSTGDPRTQVKEETAPKGTSKSKRTKRKIIYIPKPKQDGDEPRQAPPPPPTPPVHSPMASHGPPKNAARSPTLMKYMPKT
jgi:hypothetical protein